MLLDLGLIALGVVLLFFGAEVLVRGASTLAIRSGLSPLLVGLTVVAFGTSAPELVVSTEAAVSGLGGIAVGNVLGSNVANVGLILGIAAMIRPVNVDAQLLRLDIPLMIGVSVLAGVLLWDEHLSRIEGALLFAGILAYIVVSIRVARHRRDAVLNLIEEVPKPPGSAGRDLLLVGVGLGLLVLGSRALVSGAVDLAEAIGLSETVIGLTIVAVGTSLPELATSMVAAFKGESDIAIGNVVGSNLFNLLAILGIASLVHPITAPDLNVVDLGAMLAAALILFPLALTRKRLGRIEGALLLGLYAAYVASLVS